MNEPLRILVVDDEQPARNRLRELLADCSDEVPHLVVGEAANGLQALALIEDTGPDLALLDIHMPGMTGIELASHLQLLDRPPAVIFLTAHDQYAVNAFEVNAVDYLLKPVRTPRLAAALKKIASESTLQGGDARVQGLLAKLGSGPRRYLSITERGKVLLVPVAEVLFLKADSKYVMVRTAQREYFIEEPLNRLEEEFGALFVRIHRSCLVARRFIRGFERAVGEEGEGWAVVLEDWPEKLPVSRRQWPVVKATFRA